MVLLVSALWFECPSQRCERAKLGLPALGQIVAGLRAGVATHKKVTNM